MLLVPTAAGADAPPIEDETTETTAGTDTSVDPLDADADAGVEPTTTNESADEDDDDQTAAATIVFIVAAVAAGAVVGVLLLRSSRGTRT